jgi:hypothetical protein
MHILYIDDSGSVENPDEKFFVLGGVAVFERTIHHLIKGADDCVDSYGLGEASSIELHGSAMYNGREGVWKSIKDRSLREPMIHKALQIFSPQKNGVRLFAVAIDKHAISPRDPVEVAFEEICNRFNLFLQRISNRRGQNDSQRGLIIMDNNKHEKPLQALARHFRVNGSHWGSFRHLVEVPLFVDSRSTRLVQLADLVAWATFRKFEYHDGRFFDPITSLFDSDGGIIHGLYHYRNQSDACFCPACSSRGISFKQNQRDLASRSHVSVVG